MMGAIRRMPLRNLGIGARLTLAFAALVTLTIVAIGLSFLGSQRATESINRTVQQRTPAALAATRAEVDLLKMLADLRGYLALGDEQYKTSYLEAEAAFASELAELGSADMAGGDPVISGISGAWLKGLRDLFEKWKPLPPQLFTIREDQLKREPALRILITEASRPIALTIASLKKLMESQQRKPPQTSTLELLGDIAEAQSAYIAMISGLRGYVTTGRVSFKFEYDSNLDNYRRALARVARNQTLDAGQKRHLKVIETASDVFEKLPGQMFAWVEGDQARMDLFLFRTRAVPVADEMRAILSALADEQQAALRFDLDEGSAALGNAQSRMLTLGVVATAIGAVLAWLFREGIVGPVRRLTAVARDVGAGNLAARAEVENNDEIGLLARTFNEMNTRLGETVADLDRRRKEQKKAAERFRRQGEYLSALHDTSLALISQFDLDALLSDLVSRAGRLLGTPHGYIYLVDDAQETLARRVGTGLYANSIGNRLGPEQGVAGRVWSTGEPIAINEYQDWEGRFASAFYSDTIRAVAGVPLPSSAGIIGVIGLAYDVDADRQFGEEEVELLGRFGQLAALSLQNARLHAEAQEASRRVSEQNRRLESLSTKLSKYLSPQVYNSIFTGKQDVRISSHRKKLTVFFSDIAGFTETADQLESEELTGLLNRYLTEMSAIALQHGATIDKFIGDAVMAFFGDPDTKGTKEDALACVNMAIAMQRRMSELQAEWSSLGSERPFQLRIGINTGFCTVGNFGSEDRMDYTIIGSEVNLAARLQSHAELGGILLAHETYALVREEIAAEEMSLLTIKGFPRPVRTYQVVGIHADPETTPGTFSYRGANVQLLVQIDKLSEQDRLTAIEAARDLLGKLREN